MAAKKLLDIQPSELKFNYKLMNDQVSSSIRLSNRTEQYVTFKVETSNPMKYCVSPCMGIVLPESDFDVRVTVVDPKALRTRLKCVHKFSIKTVVWNLVDEDAGIPVQEFQWGVLYISPGEIQPPVVENSASSSSASENTNSNIPEVDFKLIQLCKSKCYLVLN
ncbi:hypothetical protein ABFX02_14G044700 [Erythranthe guttata]